MCMARISRSGRPTTRSARRSRSSIICRIAAPTIAISIASMCRSTLAASGARSRIWARTQVRRRCAKPCAALPSAPAICLTSAPFSARIGDFPWPQVSVIQTLARRLTAMLTTRSAERRVHSRRPALPASASLGWWRALPAGSDGCSPRPKNLAMREGARGRHQPSPPRYLVATRLGQLVLYGDADLAARAARRDVRNLQLLPARRRHRGFARSARRTPGRARRLARRGERTMRAGSGRKWRAWQARARVRPRA